MESKQGMTRLTDEELSKKIKHWHRMEDDPYYPSAPSDLSVLLELQAYRAQAESAPPRLLNDAFQMIGRLRSYLACGESTSKYDDEEIAALLERLRATQPDSSVERLEEALRSVRNYLIGLKAYLATCGTAVIIDNLENTIASMSVEVKKAEAALSGGRKE